MYDFGENIFMNNEKYLDELDGRLQVLNELRKRIIELSKAIIGDTLYKEDFFFTSAMDRSVVLLDGISEMIKNRNLALHWEHRLKNAVNRYNSIFRVQLPKITPHICRHTYCSNQAKAGMNPKTLQYLMGHSDIGVTMNTYTHLSLDDAKNEMIRMEELEQARKEVDKAEDKKPMKQNMFKVV